MQFSHSFCSKALCDHIPHPSGRIKTNNKETGITNHKQHSTYRAASHSLCRMVLYAMRVGPSGIVPPQSGLTRFVTRLLVHRALPTYCVLSFPIFIFGHLMWPLSSLVGLAPACHCPRLTIRMLGCLCFIGVSRFVFPVRVSTALFFHTL